MKTTENIMSFSHNDPVVNQSPPNARLKDRLEVDKKSGRYWLDFSTLLRDKEI